MKVEIYIPEHEVEVISRVHELKAKRRLSQEVVNLLKGCSTSISRDEVIALIKQYAYTGNGSETVANNNDILNSISSVLGGLK